MNDEKVFQKSNINWFPGHMAKARRQIMEQLSYIDIVYELVDARIPFSSKIKDIDNIIKNKKKILVMTKRDLCDLSNTNKWINYYQEKGYQVIILDLKLNNDYLKLVDMTKKVTEDIQLRRKEKGLKPKEIRALVIGIPNVGKSSLINKLANKKVAGVENKPGVTKSLTYLPTKYGITLLDTPGILWPKLDNELIAKNLASIGSIKKETLNIIEIATHIINIYLNYYPNILKEYYKIDGNDELEILENLAKMWKFCENDELNLFKTSERIYNDLVGGKVKNITLDICK